MLTFLRMLVAMGEKVVVTMGMHQVLVGMNMLVDQVHLEKEIQVTQDSIGGAFSHNRMPFVHNHRPVGYIF